MKIVFKIGYVISKSEIGGASCHEEINITAANLADAAQKAQRLMNKKWKVVHSDPILTTAKAICVLNEEGKG